MVVKHCVHGLCTSDSRYPERLPKGTVFYSFAKPGIIKEGMTNWDIAKQNAKTEKAKRWLNACGRKDFNSLTQITKDTYICSIHFVDPIEENPDPIHATSLTERSGKRKNPRARQPLEGSKKKWKENTDQEDSSVDFVNHELSQPQSSEIGQISLTQHKATQTIVSADKSILASKIESKIRENTQILSTVSNNKKQIESKNYNPMAFEAIYNDRDKFKYFTGLDPEQFIILFNFLGPAKESLQYWGTSCKSKILNFSLEEQLFITLLRLRRGFNLLTVAHFYNVSETTIRRIFTTWITFMFHHFKDHRHLIFPDRDVLKNFAPAVFRKFKNIRCSIDCTEFFCEMPQDYGRQGNNYSNYKHHCTMKCLIAVTPTGGACFVSDLFEGSIDDVRIFEESGILNYINPGDSILVDKGFTVQELLLPKQAKVFIPPFLGQRDKFTKEEVLLTKKIAKARIHVERFNERLKKFRLLDQTIPLILTPIVSQLVYVACCLVNFQDCLCK